MLGDLTYSWHGSLGGTYLEGTDAWMHGHVLRQGLSEARHDANGFLTSVYFQ